MIEIHYREKGLWCYGRSTWCNPNCNGRIYNNSCAAKEMQVYELPQWVKKLGWKIKS
jgi:hypothetical protein